jgi:hypothetical protein
VLHSRDWIWCGHFPQLTLCRNRVRFWRRRQRLDPPWTLHVQTPDANDLRDTMLGDIQIVQAITGYGLASIRHELVPEHSRANSST